jgi:hypothetical protein
MIYYKQTRDVDRVAIARTNHRPKNRPRVAERLRAFTPPAPP